MRKLEKLFFASLLIVLGFVSCDKDDDESNSFLSDFDKNMYYDSEIFNEQYISLYGQWEIDRIDGGLSGHGYEPNFDFLEIKKYGTYGFIRNDSLLEYGKIIIKSQTSEHMSITLERDDRSESFFPEPESELLIYEINTDSLSMNSENIDGFSYHFARVK